MRKLEEKGANLSNSDLLAILIKMEQKKKHLSKLLKKFGN